MTRRKSKQTLLDEQLPQAYEEIVAGPRDTAIEARAIVKPFTHANTIDWAALEARTDAAGRLLALLGRARTTQRLMAHREALHRHDENWFLMH